MITSLDDNLSVSMFLAVLSNHFVHILRHVPRERIVAMLLDSDTAGQRAFFTKINKSLGLATVAFLIEPLNLSLMAFVSTSEQVVDFYQDST